MILTTTSSVEGRTIVEYKGIVFVDFIIAMNFTSPKGNITSGFVGELINARNAALNTLREHV